MTKTLKPWHEVCDSCLSPTQIHTMAQPPEASPGDLVKCTKCQCQAPIKVDAWGAYADWPAHICIQCERDMDAGLDRVTDSVIRMLKRDAGLW